MHEDYELNARFLIRCCSFFHSHLSLHYCVDYYVGKKFVQKSFLCLSKSISKVGGVVVVLFKPPLGFSDEVVKRLAAAPLLFLLVELFCAEADVGIDEGRVPWLPFPGKGIQII